MGAAHAEHGGLAATQHGWQVMGDEWRGKQIHEKKRPRLTGRGKGPSFLRIDHRIADGEEFGSLSGNALKLLIEVARQYRPGKNGDLSIPWSLLKTRGWRSQGTVADAKKELVDNGWLIVTREGGKHLCTLYALSWFSIDPGEMHAAEATTMPPDTWKKKPSRHAE